jgi:hypothetical protein
MLLYAQKPRLWSSNWRLQNTAFELWKGICAYICIYINSLLASCMLLQLIRFLIFFPCEDFLGHTAALLLQFVWLIRHAFVHLASSHESNANFSWIFNAIFHEPYAGTWASDRRLLYKDDWHGQWPRRSNAGECASLCHIVKHLPSWFLEALSFFFPSSREDFCIVLWTH